ncbi:glycosyltransferase involved in cell wall biosynthesis [Sphingobium sp. B2D3A]|uniref:glycosyltransferase family 4 protein n=1 Tax=unclassified Sphingobium TaxID=2611147 RepID=UPI0022248279|nr:MULTISPECIES: glycosyltransferase family 4 protein [unclassified Sphingobium]MCW2338294.1 glycosyltransferase involved in cell wall biosynthesis [Sphingobium sp. B2D3A]MCW2384752.1 glycosyltransferase involved in cell wall biosynthesis [Sphingobium sp. B2D3D]
MKLAYLLNMYPLISTTFIRREIGAIEALGQPVERYALRHWDGELVDPEDIAEQARTHYIITGSKAALLWDVLLTCLLHPVRTLRVLPLWWRVWRNAGRNLVAHVAYLLEAMAFARRANAQGIDHVHTHFSTNATTVAMLARRLGGPSYSFTVHGPDELVPGEPARLSIREKARDAAFIVAITRYCHDRIVAEAPEAAQKVRIVHCGINLADFPYQPAPPESSRVICIGRLCTNKGQIHIPPAVAAVIGEFPDLVVELIGGGDDEDALREAIRAHGVEDHVILHGWGTGAYVREQLLAGRAMLLPSYAEGLPIGIMEAFAIGRPVLSTTIAGIPELLDERCGWIFAPGDEDAIAEALRGIMRATPEQRAALGAEARRRVEEQHDLFKSAQTLLDYFKVEAASGRQH